MLKVYFCSCCNNKRPFKSDWKIFRRNWLLYRGAVVLILAPGRRCWKDGYLCECALLKTAVCSQRTLWNADEDDVCGVHELWQRPVRCRRKWNRCSCADTHKPCQLLPLSSLVSLSVYLIRPRRERRCEGRVGRDNCFTVTKVEHTRPASVFAVRNTSASRPTCWFSEYSVTLYFTVITINYA